MRTCTLISYKEINKAGLSSLSRFIHKYHGGSISLARRLNLQTYDQEIGRKHQNTWTKELVFKEFKEYIFLHNIDYYPSRIELKENGSDIYTGIIQVFQSYKSFKEVLAKENYILKKKPKETKWNWKTCIKELSPIVEELGYFPSQTDLDNLNLKGLRGYISKNNLLKKLKEHFQVESKPRKYTVSRDSGYWNNIDNIKNELQNLYESYGRIPSNKELLELGYGSLHNHVKKLPREILEQYNVYSDSNLIKSKDGDYIRSIYELLFDNFLSLNNLKHKCEGLISKKSERKFLYDFKLTLNNRKIVYVEIWGYTRNRNKMEKTYHEKRLIKEQLYNKLSLNLIGIENTVFEMPFNDMYSYFTKQILRFDSKFKARKMDLKYLLWGSNFNEADIISQLRLIIKDNCGFFPTTSQLRKLQNGEGLISKIQKFGGVSYFKKMLNSEIQKKASKWTIDFLKNELIIINNLRYLPSYSDLNSMNRLDILGGIQKNGGFKKVSSKLKIPSKSEYLKLYPQTSQTKWSKTFLLEELSSIIDKYHTIPSETELIKIGRSDLVAGIKKNGGFIKIKEELGLKSSRKKWTEEKVIRELNLILKDSVVFPTSKQFKEMERGDLLAGINSLGGLNFFRLKLGFKTSKQGKKTKSFTLEDLISDVEKVINELGYFPSTNDLSRLDKVYIASRIQTIGGFQKLRRIMGYELRKK